MKTSTQISRKSKITWLSPYVLLLMLLMNLGQVVQGQVVHQDILDYFNANINFGNNQNGVFGWNLDRINSLGQVQGIDSQSPNAGFYPASSIKPVQALYIIKLAVESGDVNDYLDNNSIAVCPCGPAPNDCNACSDAPNSDINACNNNQMTLRQVITNALVEGSQFYNPCSNALQDYIGTLQGNNQPQPGQAGRGVMNGYCQNTLDMGSTTFFHKWICNNKANNPANTSTLNDYNSFLNKMAADQSVITQENLMILKSMMMDETNTTFMRNAVNVEANNIGKGQFANAFNNKMFFVYKNGNVNTNTSRIMLVQIPINNGNYRRIYSMSIMADNFVGTNGGWSRNEASLQIFRSLFRGALYTWTDGLNKYQNEPYEESCEGLGEIIDLGGAPQQPSLELGKIKVASALKELKKRKPNVRKVMLLLEEYAHLLEVGLIGAPTPSSVRCLPCELRTMARYQMDKAYTQARAFGVHPNLQSELSTIERQILNADDDTDLSDEIGHLRMAVELALNIPLDIDKCKPVKGSKASKSHSGKGGKGKSTKSSKATTAKGSKNSKNMSTSFSSEDLFSCAHPAHFGFANTGSASNKKSFPKGQLVKISPELTIYPNPFSGSTTIQLESKISGWAKVEVFNINGEQLANLYDGQLDAGESIKLNFGDDSQPTGIYLVKMNTVNGSTIKKIVKRN